MTPEMVSFLCTAKRKTYAGKGAATASSRISSHDLIYSESDLTYYDSYLGGECFSGEEALWQKELPLWAMNYCGRVIDSGFSGDFLKEALYQVQEDYPFRGPLIYRKDDYTYHCVINGSIEWFQGYEEIFYLDKKVYECCFHGGNVR